MSRWVLSILLCLATISPTLAEGSFTIVWEEPRSIHCKNAKVFLEIDPFLESLPDALNQTLSLPRDIPIVFRETGKLDAYYSPDEHKIVLSYDLISRLVGTFRGPKYRFQTLHKTRGTLNFILLHEVAHALIHELNLPVVGREEDAADEYATFFSAYWPQERSFEIARCAADWFGEHSELSDIDLPYWDEHSLNGQRHFDILADFYASNPTQYAFVESMVPQERLEQAVRAHPLKEKTWSRLLAKHLKKPTEVSLFTRTVPDTATGRFLTQRSSGASAEQTLTWFNSTFHITNDISLASVAPLYSESEISKIQIAPEQRAQLLKSSEEFGFLVQLCRSLLQVYDLPITGPSDEAAEDLAAILAARRPVWRSTLLDIAYLHEQHSFFETRENFAQSGSLKLQKLYNILSYLYLEDPETYPFYPQCLPPELKARQLEKSKQVYQKKRTAWQELLSPYSKLYISK